MTRDWKLGILKFWSVNFVVCLFDSFGKFRTCCGDALLSLTSFEVTGDGSKIRCYGGMKQMKIYNPKKYKIINKSIIYLRLSNQWRQLPPQEICELAPLYPTTPHVTSHFRIIRHVVVISSVSTSDYRKAAMPPSTIWNISPLARRHESFSRETSIDLQNLSHSYNVECSVLLPRRKNLSER